MRLKGRKGNVPKEVIMIDIKLLRENPDLVKENIKKKFQDDKLVLVAHKLLIKPIREF